MVSHRSTKGASKARRDHINREIRNMRALLPIGQEEQERLSYLHSMAAICTYIRKSVLLRGLPAGDSQSSPPYEAFLQALHGFILVTTARGRLVYVSENVSEYLGLSMIDVLQGDTVYDMVERCDVDAVKSNLDLENNSSSERSFVCRMQTSKAFKARHGSCGSTLVRGSFQSLPQLRPSSPAASSTSRPLFVALCTPTANRLKSADVHRHGFSSLHSLDMTFTQLSDSVVYHLGYSPAELTGRSWYALIHPDQLSLGADSHRRLLEADEGVQVETVLRLQCEDLSWTWIYIRANKDSVSQTISCTNYIISETEARFLQEELGSDVCGSTTRTDSCDLAAQRAPDPHSHSNAKCMKRRRGSLSQSEEPGAKARRESGRDTCYVACVYSRGESPPAPMGETPALFTPPYSPASSPSSSSFSSSPSLQPEELSRDLLMDVHGYTDQQLSSPEASPSYYSSYVESGLTCRHTPSGSLPASAGHIFDHGSFGAFSCPSPLPCSSPAYDFQSCTSDARLVPDCLTAADACESSADCALHQDAFSSLEQPEGGVFFHAHQVPHQVPPTHPSLLTPNQSPTSAESSQYDAREQAEISILAQQISSLARSFDMYHTLTPSGADWPHHPPLPPLLKRELVLEDSVFDSILKDLDMVPGKSSGGPDAAVAAYQQASVRDPLGLSEDPLPSERFTAMDPFSVQLGRHDQNTGLHQLNHYTQGSLQQDGLAQDNLY